MDISHRFYTCLLVEHIELEKNTSSLFRIQVVRHKTKSKYTKTRYRAMSYFYITDAERVAYYLTEFCFPIKVVPSSTTKNKEQIFSVKLEEQNICKKKIETLGRWYFDAANLENPSTTDIQKSTISTKTSIGKATLYFRLCIVPFSECVNGQPIYFFNFAGKVNLPQTIELNEISQTSTMATETQFDDENNTVVLTPAVVEPKPEPKLEQPTFRFADFLKSVGNSSSVKKAKKKKPKGSDESAKKKKGNDASSESTDDRYLPFFGSPKKPKKKSSGDEYINLWNQTGVIQQFTKNYDQNQHYLMILAVNQCYPHVLRISTEYIFPVRTIVKDYSDAFLEPFITFGIFQLPALTSEALSDLMKPLMKGIELSIIKQHSKEELFSLFATTLNFGVKISNIASLYTSAHLECLECLANYIKTIVETLIQHLCSTIGANISKDGFEIANENAMIQIDLETRSFFEYARGLNIPEILIQNIVVHTCSYLDRLIYNVIVETAPAFTNEKVTKALDQIRMLQTIFQCLPNNFQTAFSNLIELFTMSKSLFFEVGDEKQINDQKAILDSLKKGPLLRSIVDRCEPPIVLPKGKDYDYFGERLQSYDILALPLECEAFDFSFDWLYAQNETNKWDEVM